METRFAGLSVDGDAACCSALAALARLQAEKSFLRRTCRRRKRFKILLRLRAQTLRGRRKETNMMKIDRVLAVAAGTKEMKVDCH